MGRTRKTETATAKPRTRKPKAETPATEQHTPKELELLERYPTVNILPGSWRASRGRSDTHGKKVTVITICTCSTTEQPVHTVRATSDLWQCGTLCPLCTKTRRRGRKTTREAKAAL